MSKLELILSLDCPSLNYAKLAAQTIADSLEHVNGLSILPTYHEELEEGKREHEPETVNP